MRCAIEALRGQNKKIALVPTMGNLHQGHLSLIQQAQILVDKVVVSIFVNPMQFGPNEDFANYPRTLTQDMTCLAESQCDIVFIPNHDELYPIPLAKHTKVSVPELSDDLCGISRPQFFYGVSTIVCKLFNIVQPHIAIFGEKDFQQLMIIRKMVADLCLPIEIISGPIVREQDGLAMSSRNVYLTATERTKAPQLFQIISRLAQQLENGDHDYASLIDGATQQLVEAGFKTDYVAIRRQQDLQAATADDKSLIILAAAFLGKTRLIDNVKVDLR